ncbi:hypothetical protein ACFORL_07160 [Legionella dresdenensis]|uniref:Uncharacterized protein n=1 Tax=Legionella dresdenensis TaxID=450200 RepID=A0ABV8CF04_9GAMM
MNKKILLICASLWNVALYAVTTASVTSSHINDETKAFQQCQHYIQQLGNRHVHGHPIDCKLMNHNAQEWLCMEQQQLKLHVPEQQAMKRCFRTAPAARIMQQQHVNTRGITANSACVIAFSTFSKFYPGDDRLALLSKQCYSTRRTALEWLCMNHFAEGGNSYNYAAGQCFPR